MKIKKLLKNNENIIIKLVILALIILLALGLSLNSKLVDVTDIKEEEILINSEEKEFLLNMKDEKNNRDVEVFEKEYLEVLLKLQNKQSSKENTLNIGRVNYYLGYNRLLNGDISKAIDFFEDALSSFEETTYYFYILNTRLDLMNLYFKKFDYISALKNANEIYSILKRNDIEGISEEEQETIEIQVLSGIVATASNFGMKDVSEKFYKELVKLTEGNEEEESNISVNAKYQYNINNKNIEEAKKYALKYIDFFKDKNELIRAQSQIYLLETLIINEEIYEAERIFNDISDVIYKFNDPISTGYINKLIGMYYEIKGDYNNAFKYYVESIRILEEEKLYRYCTEINNKVIKLYDKVDIDLEYFIGKVILYQENYKYEDEVSALADSLVKVDLEKLEEENNKIIEEMNKSKTVNKISKKLNLLYVLIIVSLGLIIKILNDEVKKRKAKEEELQKMIEIDYLTKSYSKQYTHKRLEELKDNNEKFSVCIIDLDNFKKINDTYGHNFGDEVLLKTVTAIKDDIEDDGIIGRFGGEEFILIFKDSVKIEDIPERVKNSIKNIKWSIEGFNVTVSGGAKKYNDEDIKTLISEIDRLLYKAKAEGKDRILLD